ncbi:hypothetical protein [Peribacillus simplex]|uniref:hypothetical protein n=1 Tax=Peribacillus simplex TaxID=1478 RepID=UPI0025A183D0|nr:hypothetical protein [Peribacillus simplex]
MSEKLRNTGNSAELKKRLFSEQTLRLVDPSIDPSSIISLTATNKIKKVSEWDHSETFFSTN